MFFMKSGLLYEQGVLSFLNLNFRTVFNFVCLICSLKQFIVFCIYFIRTRIGKGHTHFPSLGHILVCHSQFIWVLFASCLECERLVIECLEKVMRNGDRSCGRLWLKLKKALNWIWERLKNGKLALMGSLALFFSKKEVEEFGSFSFVLVDCDVSATSLYTCLRLLLCTFDYGGERL